MYGMIIYTAASVAISAGAALMSPAARAIAMEAAFRIFPARTGHGKPFRLFMGSAAVSGILNAGRRISSERVRERMDRAIYDSIGTIRNMIASRDGAGIPADVLFEQLSLSGGDLSFAFRRALPLLRVNRTEEMIKRFSSDAGTDMARDFISILAKWDEVSPDKLSSTLLSYQRAIRETRTTYLKRRMEMLSDLVYFPAVLNVLVVLVNFIFVSYYIEQRELFESLFF